jgi:hypothetical protein
MARVDLIGILVEGRLSFGVFFEHLIKRFEVLLGVCIRQMSSGNIPNEGWQSGSCRNRYQRLLVGGEKIFQGGKE